MIAASQLLEGKQHPGLAVGEDGPVLIQLMDRIEPDHDRPNAQGGEQDNKIFRPGRRKDRDAITPRYPVSQ